MICINKKMFSLKIFICIFFIAVYLLTSGGHIYREDEYLMFLLTKSIFNGHLYLDEIHSWAIAGQNGKYYPWYEVGISVFALPFYFVGLKLADFFHLGFLLQFFFSLTHVFLMAILGVVFFSFAYELGYGIKISILLTFLLGLGSNIWMYSKMGGSEAISSLMLLVTIYFLFLNQKYKKNYYLILSGIFFGLSLFCRSTFILLFPLLISFLLEFNFKKQLDKNDIKHFIVFTSITGIFLFLIFYLNYFRMGIWCYDLRQLVQHFGFEIEKYNFWQGLVGYIVSPGRSIFIYNPFLVLLAFLRWENVSFRNAKILFISIFAFFLIGNSISYGWAGGWCWGPRYLLPTIPLLTLCIGDLVKKLYMKGKKYLVIIFAFSFLFTFVTVSNNCMNYYLTIDTGNFQYTLNKMMYSIKDNPVLFQVKIFPEYLKKTIINLKSKDRETLRDVNNFQIWRKYRFCSLDYWLLYFYFGGISAKIIIGILFTLLFLIFIAFIKIKKFYFGLENLRE